MKNGKILLTTVITFFLTQACISLFEQEPKVLMVSGEETCGPLNKSLSFNVECDLKWTVSLENADWASLVLPEENAQKGNGTIKIRFDCNTSLEDRSGEVVVKSGSKEVRKAFTQSGMDGFFQPETIHLSGSKSVKFSFNTPFSWSIKKQEGAEWIILDAQEGAAGAVSVYVKAVDQNENVGQRTGSLLVRLGEYEFLIPVVQDQKDVILTDDTDVRFNYHACEFTVRINSNVSYEVRSSVPWIQHLPHSKSLNESSERLRIEENTGEEDRSAVVYFTSPDGASLSVNVTQTCMDMMLRIKTPGIYGLDGKDYILGRDGWRMSSRVVDADGCFEYRLVAPASLSVFKIAGFDEDSEEGDTFEVHVVRQDKEAVTLVRDFQSTVLGLDEKMIWLKSFDGVCFICQR